MAVIRDVMPAFELFQPASIDDAVGLLDKYGKNAWVMAGGLDTFDWLKTASRNLPWSSSYKLIKNSTTSAAALKSAR